MRWQEKEVSVVLNVKKRFLTWILVGLPKLLTNIIYLYWKSSSNPFLGRLRKKMNDARKGRRNFEETTCEKKNTQKNSGDIMTNCDNRDYCSSCWWVSKFFIEAMDSPQLNRTYFSWYIIIIINVCCQHSQHSSSHFTDSSLIAVAHHDRQLLVFANEQESNERHILL